jgi:hypothetical protein
MPIYRSSPDPAPDEAYEPGTLAHLVPGARGRLLDPRRTPVSVVEVRPSMGFVLLRIEDFEDAGAIWEVPLEHAGHYQFELAGPRVGDADVAQMEAAIERFARVQTIEPDDAARAQTEARIADAQQEAARWLRAHSRFLASGRPLPSPAERRGDPDLVADLGAWLRGRDLWGMEDAFTRAFVSNPHSGEIVKGHRIVLAELGLAGYHGSIVRDPTTFEGPWSRERRAQHVISRLAFLRAAFAALGIVRLAVWRGASIEGRLAPRPGRTFISTSADEAVAREHFEGGKAGWTHVLVRQAVPVGQLFMTFHETAAMNGVFLEAEVVLLARGAVGWP